MKIKHEHIKLNTRSCGNNLRDPYLLPGVCPCEGPVIQGLRAPQGVRSALLTHARDPRQPLLPHSLRPSGAEKRKLEFSTRLARNAHRQDILR